MLGDRELAHWVRTGDRGGRAFPDRPGPQGDPQDRLAAYAALVHRRTTALVGPGGHLQAPWPRALGTPPWGVCRELESLVAPPGTRYGTVLVRRASPLRLGRLIDTMAARIGPRRPGVLYVGSRWLPRHVALVVPSSSGSGVAVYDPGGGTVRQLDGWLVGELAGGGAEIGGWGFAWLLCMPLPPSDARPASSA